MRHITVLFCSWSLAMSVAACSDDGIVPQQDASGGSGTTQGTAPPADSDGGLTGGTSANDDGSTGPATGPSDGGSSGTSGAPDTDGITTGPPADTEGTSTGGEGSTSSGGEESSSGGCEPLADDSAIGQDCGPGGFMCPPGYTCQPFVGFAFQETCQILCTQDCECPGATTCQMVVDKTGIPWQQCQ